VKISEMIMHTSP